MDRACNVVPDFAITPENRRAVIELCTCLDGMPLAIEFAAARFQSMSVTQLLDRLDQRFRLLSRGSSCPAPPPYAPGLDRLELRAVQPSGTNAVATALGVSWGVSAIWTRPRNLRIRRSRPDFVLDLLDRPFVSKSIVLTERTGETVRYRLLMTVREYGAEQLEEGRGANCSAATATVICAERKPWSISGAALDRASSSSEPGPNATIDGCPGVVGEYAGRVDRRHTPAVALRHHWVSDGYLSEGRHWLDSVLDGYDDAAASPGPWGGLVGGQLGHSLQGDHQAGAEYLAECREVATMLDDDGVTGPHPALVGDCTVCSPVT